MKHFMNWLDQTRIALVSQISGGDPRKTVLVYALATLALGIAIGAVLTRPLGAIVLLLAGSLLGYAARSFVSHRRRKAFLDAKRQS